VVDPAGFLRSCIRCTASEGLLIFGLPSANGFLGSQPDEILDMPPHHLTRWGEETFWRIAPLFGVEVVSIEPLPISDPTIVGRIAALNAMRKRLGEKGKYFFVGKRYDRLSRLATWVAPWLLLGIRYDQNLHPRGHSFLAVLRKLS